VSGFDMESYFVEITPGSWQPNYDEARDEKGYYGKLRHLLDKYAFKIFSQLRRSQLRTIRPSPLIRLLSNRKIW
jgi:hypothetical protein